MSDKAAADFMQDQLEALLASPALARVARRHDESAASDEQPISTEKPIPERDTEPSTDVQMLRDALRVGLKQ